MKRFLNTLYVTTQGAYLAREGQSVLVRVERQTRLRVPVHTIGSIVCFGRVGCSTGVLDLCGQSGVAIAHLSERGRFIARVHGPTSGNVLLRREQYRRADDPGTSASIAAAVVGAKIANARTALIRALRDHSNLSGAHDLRLTIRRLGGALTELRPGVSLDRVRGIEGEAARDYFDAFDHLITSQKGSFAFNGRNRRPPMDAVNALLSFLYTLLVHDVGGAVEAVGLDPAVGFLHRDRPGRPSLALDLMEEFRALLADRLALSLINLRQVQAGGFETSECGAVSMDDATRKTVLIAYQKRKQQAIRHPFLGEQTTVGMLVHLQALLLARHLRGDLDAYAPFLWK